MYVLGDSANIAAAGGGFLPQLAAVAQQSGDYCARNIIADIALRPRQPFRYVDKGIMAMIGRKAAVAEIGEHRHEFDGAIGFAAWLGVHAALLPSARSMVGAFMEWAWDYFGKDPSDQILDRTNQAVIPWTGGGSEDRTASPPTSPQSTPEKKVA